MTRVTCRLTAKTRDQLRNPALDNRVRATFIFLMSVSCYFAIFLPHDATLVIYGFDDHILRAQLYRTSSGAAWIRYIGLQYNTMKSFVTRAWSAGGPNVGRGVKSVQEFGDEDIFCPQLARDRGVY